MWVGELGNLEERANTAMDMDMTNLSGLAGKGIRTKGRHRGRSISLGCLEWGDQRGVRHQRKGKRWHKPIPRAGGSFGRMS